MQTQTRTRLTIEQYYAFYLMRRDDNVLPHGAGRLFQQWAVDAYCKIEGQRLQWARDNQDTLRAAERDAINDWVQSTSASAPMASAVPAATASATTASASRPASGAALSYAATPSNAARARGASSPRGRGRRGARRAL